MSRPIPLTHHITLIAALAGGLIAVSPFAATSALADLRVCNTTTNPISVSLGYRADRGWQSEGWWIAPPNDCTTVYQGDLNARYYYLFAADDMGGGSWDGGVFMCTQDESFTIFGVEDCLARGYERTGFFEVDTGERQNWTLQLTQANASTPADADATVEQLDPDQENIGNE